VHVTRSLAFCRECIRVHFRSASGKFGMSI
jgi:hypothetical protein